MKNKIIFLVFNLLLSSFAFSMESNQIDKDKLGQKLISYVINKSTKKVKKLIMAGADVNAKDNCGCAALIYASRDGHKEIVDILIKAGADVNAKDQFGNTALMYASLKGHKEIVELLIKAKANVNFKDDYGVTGLMFASCTGHREIVELLINAGADVNSKDRRDNTSLIGASANGHKEIVDILIKAGADVNAKSKIDDSTVLIAASAIDDKNTVELLNTTVNSWKKEVYKAIDNNDIASFRKYILKIGTICFKDKNGNNILHYAMKVGNIEFTKLILSLNQELIAQVNKDGQTPLSFIGANGEFVELFKSLFTQEINPNKKRKF